MPNTVKFAVVGCGHIGIRHATIIQANTQCQLVALCDIKPEEDLAVAHFGVPVFSSIEALLAADLDFEVLNICTPNGCHAEQALLALEAGKHVVCEKPMALRRSDCEAIIAKAEERQREVFCVMQNRYSPPSAWAKDLIDKNLLGDIFLVQVNCYWNRDERYYRPGGRRHDWHGRKAEDGGTLFTQFSHFIDTLYWLFGDIKNLTARFADFNHAELTEFEDTGMVHFEFVDGGFGALNYSTAVWQSNLESSLTIIGSKGSIKIGGQYMNEVEYCHIEGYEMPALAAANPPNDYGPYKGSAANHHFVIENVVEVLRGRKNIDTDAYEGLKVVDIIERIYALKKVMINQL